MSAGGGFASAGAGSAAMAAGLVVSTAAVSALMAILSSLPAATSTASAAFEQFARTAEDGAESAAQAVSAACSRMAAEVSSLHLKLPRIQVGPLPHFSMRGSFNPKTGSVPSVSVSWYARGGVFDGASVIGVGESGPEAVVPLSGRRMKPFAKAIAEGMGGTGKTVNNYYTTSAPRVCGDDPDPRMEKCGSGPCSPRMRG